jgi:hypothetical protein
MCLLVNDAKRDWNPNMTTTTEKQLFIPNCVFIPASEGNPESKDYDPQRKNCTLLIADGDSNYAECFTQEAWENDGEPFCYLRYRKFETENGDEIEGGHVDYLPDLWVVKIDEREHWSSEIRSQCPRMYGVYVVDRRYAVHICSITASYELYFLGTQYDEKPAIRDDDDRHERLNMEIIGGDAMCEEWHYFDAHEIDAMFDTKCREGFFPPRGKSGGFQLTGIMAVTREKAIEEAAEAYRGSEF